MSIFLHLPMTGRFARVPEDAHVSEWDSLAFTFDNFQYAWDEVDKANPQED